MYCPSKRSREPNLAELLEEIMVRTPDVLSESSSSRIERVGSPLGSVAVGIYPNEKLKTIAMVIVDHKAGQLITQWMSIRANGDPEGLLKVGTPFYDARAFIDDERVNVLAGYKSPLHLLRNGGRNSLF